MDYEIQYQKKDELGAVCQDFNEMRLYLKQSVDQRLEFEQRRRELITGISHDLRTPLTSIKGYLDGLLDGIASTEEMRQRYLQAIKIRTQDLERLVDSLSTYNRLENPSFRYRMQEINLKSFIEDYLTDSWDRFGRCEGNCKRSWRNRMGRKSEWAGNTDYDSSELSFIGETGK